MLQIKHLVLFYLMRYRRSRVDDTIRRQYKHSSTTSVIFHVSGAFLRVKETHKKISTIFGEHSQKYHQAQLDNQGNLI